ncbi:MAG TPA: hypothetical protein VK395_04750 [Gemmataceae bacterium]|nr:hypothetical protein [Gemmataceae bacterium]
MARFLALDWDHKQLHIVAAVINGGTVRIQKTAVFAEEQTPNPAEAEALGQRLRDHLKEAGIAPAPVLACIGRDRVILKEVRYPAVKAAEEPALVRFQVAKELTDPLEEMVLDYAPTGEATPGGEQRALALIIRRELLGAYQTLCQAAGLKLAALVPRPVALLACLGGIADAQASASATGEGLAILSLTERWAELAVARAGMLFFARSLPGGAALTGEVRRNLAVYAGQWPQHPIRALYVADGAGEHTALCQRLQDLLSYPVHAFDPFAGIQAPGVSIAANGSFAAAVGLLRTQAQRRPFAINFVKPKEPKPPDDSSQRRLLIAGALAACVLLALGWLGYAQLARKDRELAALQEKKLLQDALLHKMQEDDTRFLAIDEWSETQISWLDELYDLTDRFPNVQSVRLVQMFGEPSPRAVKNKNGGKQAGLLVLKGILNNTSARLLDQLIGRFVEDGHYTGGIPDGPRPNRSVDRPRFQLEFGTKFTLDKRLPTEYKLRLPAEDGEGEENAGRDRGRRSRGRGNDFGPDAFGGGEQP